MTVRRSILLCCLGKIVGKSQAVDVVLWKDTIHRLQGWTVICCNPLRTYGRGSQDVTVTLCFLPLLNKGIYGAKARKFDSALVKCSPPYKGGDGDFLQPPSVQRSGTRLLLSVTFLGAKGS